MDPLERRLDLLFTECGLFATAELRQFSSFEKIPGIGTLAVGDCNHSPSFLVVEAEHSVISRPIPQRRGGTLYSVDQDSSPESVNLRPSGLFEENTVIEGLVRTGSDHPASHALYGLIRKRIVSYFERIQEYYVGPQAAQLLDRGWRLTQAVKAPLGCDLKRSA